MELNGRTVLEVEGNYMSDNGMPTNYIRSIFFEADSSGRNVIELYMMATDHSDFIMHEQQYQYLISSIVWR